MPTYKTTKGGGISYSMKGGGGGTKGIPTKAPTSQAARDFAAQPRSKAIKDPKLGYAGSKDKSRND
jgi:hypothetical protein